MPASLLHTIKSGNGVNTTTGAYAAFTRHRGQCLSTPRRGRAAARGRSATSRTASTASPAASTASQAASASASQDEVIPAT
ncbi:hypothetical protein VFPFJ_03230 [Purpureocillium lilacinum]|uniref:Uncharacterized protein n=1 Tax=Purpureocillium lilacinum TaxID=33203 RepID=A0A179HPX8_PURLI|nr:hypothetical protein VFPFJ_03230 [Purpureocillium lilacinum]OAQ91490.1 hypothetical protein VFPFJ_03230 [Purpureocillium lilacinum]